MEQTVLLVEDYLPQANLIRTVLEGPWIKIDIAHTLLEAQQRISSESIYAALITDTSLTNNPHREEWLEIAAEFRKRFPNAPIVAISNEDRSSWIPGRNCTIFIMKSPSIMDLADQIMKTLTAA